MQTTSKSTLLKSARADARKWSRYVDRLLEAFHSSGNASPILAPGMEALRNKRDTLVTKVQALARHQEIGWSRAQSEVERARRELRDSWRIVISALDRESTIA